MVRVYDTPNYLYDKGVSYFLRILGLEFMAPQLFIPFNYLYDKGVSYFLYILWLEYMIPPAI